MNDAVGKSRARLPSTDISARQAKLDSVSAQEHPKCLMCGAANAFGMKLDFEVQRDGSVRAAFSCRQILQSYPETLHGGIISAVLDAAMTNLLFSIGVVAVTAELTVRFLAPAALGSAAEVRAAIAKPPLHPLYYVRAELEQDHQVVARATAKFLVKNIL